jgi:hypothetical protein
MSADTKSAEEFTEFRRKDGTTAKVPKRARPAQTAPEPPKSGGAVTAIIAGVLCVAVLGGAGYLAWRQLRPK